MRKTFVILGFAVLATALQGVAQPTPAACARCRTTECRSSDSCGNDACVCLKEGRERRGKCFSSDDAFPEGYTELK